MRLYHHITEFTSFIVANVVNMSSPFTRLKRHSDAVDMYRNCATTVPPAPSGTVLRWQDKKSGLFRTGDTKELGNSKFDWQQTDRHKQICYLPCSQYKCTRVSTGLKKLLIHCTRVMVETLGFPCHDTLRLLQHNNSHGTDCRFFHAWIFVAIA